MAIYHLEAKVISRGAGRSAVAASAYMSCSRLCNDYDGIEHDYTKKGGLVYQEVMLPPEAPAEWADREKLWNAVEGSEKAKDSRLAREFVAALPAELSEEEWKKLLRQYVKDNFVAEGMCADFSIHDPVPPGHNPHAHIILTVRPLDENGNWQYKTEKEYLCVRNGEERGFTAGEFLSAQKDGWEKQYPYKPEKGKKNIYLPPSEAERRGLTRADKNPKATRYGRQNPTAARWNSEGQLARWREAWADITNGMLSEKGINERIDHRSFKDRGITGQPTIHEGVSARIIEKQGFRSERCETNRQIRADNSLIRELKALIASLQEKAKQGIRDVAEKLESLRDSLIVNHYQSVYNDDLLYTVRYFMENKKPPLERLMVVRRDLRQKVAEKKQLSAEKKNTPVWDAAKHLKLAVRISTLTEDISELSSERERLMSDLGCKDDKEVIMLDKKIKSLPGTKKRAEEQQKKLKQQKEKNLREFKETFSTVSPGDMDKVESRRSELRRDRRGILIKKVSEVYGDNFDRRQFNDSEEAVDKMLPKHTPAREKPSLMKALEEKTKQAAEAPSMPRQKGRDRGAR